MTSSAEFRFKSIRDSIYGYIGVSEEEVGLMNTGAVLRMGGIKQLAHTYLVYPTAMHTRYEHSLGAMHMAGRMCDQLELDAEDKRLARMAALLHDVGHGPFSHTFEGVLERLNPGRAHIHETIGRMMIEGDAEIADCLGGTRHDIAKILEGKAELNRRHSLISDIVSSNLDADKLDYFARDSHNLGVKYGVVDTERILHVLRHDEDKRHLGVLEKGVPALDGYRLARYMIGRQIYTHRVRLAADQMFLCAVDAAFDEGVLDRGDFRVDSGSFLDFYAGLDDNTLIHNIVRHPKSRLSGKILADIRRRRLLKACFEGTAKTTAADSKDSQVLDTPTVLRSAAADIRASLGLQGHELVVHESDLEIRLFQNDDFLVFDDRGRPREIVDVSPVQMASATLSYYVFGRADVRGEVTQMLAKRGIVTKSTT